MSKAKAETLIKRANIALARHQATRMFAPFIVGGSWRIEENADKCPTAMTNGKEEIYGMDFVLSLPNERQVRFLVMHENGHEFLLHLQRQTPEMKKNPQLSNIAMDYVINGMLVKIAKEYPDLLERIPIALYDAKYDGWSVLQVFNDLKKNATKVQGKKSLDQHDSSRIDEMSKEEMEAEGKRISSGLQEGSLMAGITGDTVPQNVKDAMAPQIDWRKETEEFFAEVSHGRDDLTLRSYDRRYVADDLFYPSTESETLGEIVLGIDTSGSTTGPILDKLLAVTQDFCQKTLPSSLRVLWWDTDVRAEQVFSPSQYDNITRLAKPMGGGGTRASCVSDFMGKHNIKPDAVLMFTDGYTEDRINWQVTAPTLWLVTENRHFTAPRGRQVRTEV